jgi:DnaJ-domain-containing protein 1
MWKRIARILRAEVESAGRSVADAVRRVRRGERYDAGRPGGASADRAATGGAAERAVPPEDVRRAFAALELPLTATVDEIRRAYRKLMARYHPDHHTEDPDLERVATELSRKLTAAYDKAAAWKEAATSRR